MCQQDGPTNTIEETGEPISVHVLGGLEIGRQRTITGNETIHRLGIVGVEGLRVRVAIVHIAGQLAQERNLASPDQRVERVVLARNLAARQGLSIVVTWPKGLILEPTAEEKRAWFIADNKPTILGFAGLIVVFLYYLMVWGMFGRDQAHGSIVPLYEPPDSMSPAAVRFLERMGFDEKAFTAGIIGLAAKGYLTIEQDESRNYKLVRKSKTPEERSLYYSALASALDPALASETLAIALTDEISSELSRRLILWMASEGENPEIVLEFVKRHFERLADKQDSSFRATFISSLMVNFSDPVRAEELKQFAPAYETSNGRDEADRARERILADAEFVVRQLPAIDEWVRQHKVTP